MAKTESKTVSKSASSNSNASKNVASGGQVYDRTTGTWEGETKGSFGDGKNHHQGGTTKVWRDANGIVGVEQLTRPVLQKARTNGPGSGGVASGLRVGTGAGVGGAVGSAIPGPLPRLSTGLIVKTPGQSLMPEGFNYGAAWPVGETPPAISYSGHDGLIPQLHPNKQAGRQFPMGPLTWESNPYWPTGAAIEDEFGEGELSPGTPILWLKTAADVRWNIDRLVDHTVRNGSAWASEVNLRLNSSFPAPDEPVFNPDYNWGR